MEPKAAPAAPFKLELVEDVPPAVTAAAPIVAAPPPEAPPLPETSQPSAMPASGAPAFDRFLALARREHDGGLVDQALWSRSLALANGDEAAALPPYLRARAAMLKLAAGRAPIAGNAAAAVAANDEPPPAKVRSRPKALLFAGLGVAAIAVVAGTWFALVPSGEPTAAPMTASKAKPATKPADSPAAEAPVDPGPELAARVAALKQQGNWNVLVLHANEWTRRKPDDATAWSELANGYLRLKQVDEAFEAAKRAVALQPNDAASHRLLAAIYVALDRPLDALPAVERAVEIDPAHADGFAQLGAVQAKLGKLAEARNAYERALALDPVHVAASCGVLDVSRAQGRARDAEALAKAMQAAQIACPEAAAPVGAATAPATAAARTVPVRR